MKKGAAIRGLHVLADDDAAWSLTPVAQARAACAGGARVVQLRAKHAADGTALEWGHAIRAITRAAGVTFIVNDRFDWALACDADGVHLGQDDLPPSALPEPARKRLVVGRSTHDVNQARAACREEVDYLAFGPLFETDSKDTGYGARGLERLAEIARVAKDRPVIAIGGIDVARAAAARAAGAAGVAVIGAVAGAADPVESTRALARSIEGP